MAQPTITLQINTWWKRKKNGQTYFLKDKGFGKVALVEMYKNNVITITEEEFITQAVNGNFIRYNEDGTLQV